MTEVEGKSEQELETILDEVKKSIEKVFPDYNVLDRSRWDGYKKDEDDIDNGRLLSFYRGEISPENSQIMFILHKNGGHVMNFYNNPSGFGSETHISFRGGSVYLDYDSEVSGYWWPDQIELSVESVKIWQEGIPLTPEIVNQPAFIVGSEDRIATVREVIEGAQKYFNAKPKDRKQMDKDELFMPKRLFEFVNEEAKRVLIAKRIGEDISEQIGDQFWKELYKLDSWHQMLWQKGILRSKSDYKLPE